ncbi:MAG: histidine kinase dimerization/phospho-acceptor domain-containing protein [Ilumatobacteraceae bacterium]
MVGVIAGLRDRIGRSSPDQLELIELHANLASVAIEREALLEELTERNQLLESLRACSTASPAPSPPVRAWVALLPLCQAVGADSVALFEQVDGVLVCRAVVESDRPEGSTARPSPDESNESDGSDQCQDRAEARAFFDEAIGSLTVVPAVIHRFQVLPNGIAAVVISDSERGATLAARWTGSTTMSSAALDLLEDAARSLALALEREAAEHALRESAALRQANAIQRDFLYRLSHELRTPLTAIRGFADTLRQPDVSWDSDTHQRFLERISTESARMGRLVTDLLDSSALEGGGLKLHPDWCDLALLLDEAAACVFADPSDLSIEVGDGLPPIWADHDRIEQVLVNLFENAIRHGRPPVSCVTTFDDQVVTIRVGDDGSGLTIPTEAIFDANVRGATSRGTGLGLAIARGIAAAHGGSLVIDDASPRTVFALRLPIEPSASSTFDDGGPS